MLQPRFGPGRPIRVQILANQLTYRLRSIDSSLARDVAFRSGVGRASSQNQSHDLVGHVKNYRNPEYDIVK